MIKNGIGCFFGLFFGCFCDLVKLNLVFCLFALPSAAAFLFGFFGFFTGLMYALSLLAAIPVGGAVAAYVFCVTKMLRDQPGYVIHDFKRKFSENVKQAAVPGMLCVAAVYAQVLACGTLIFSGTNNGGALLPAVLCAVVIFWMIAPYVFLQIAYVDLGTTQIVKNSILISLRNAPRSFFGVITGGAVWAAFILYLPVSLLATPLILLIGFSLSWVLWLMWIWPPVNKEFKIEEALQ